MSEAWQGIIIQPLGGFIAVLVGTMLLFAEVLVRGRFLLGLVGLASISLYFLAHIQEGQMFWMAVLFLGGICLVVIDGKFFGDGTMAALGVLLMLIALAWPSPSILYGAGVVMAFFIGAASSFLFLRWFPRRELWTKLMLTESLSSDKGYNSLSEKYKELVGQVGIAQTDFRPTGTIKIGDQLYSASSEGIWIRKGTPLKVIKVSGTHILVQKVADEDE